MPEGIDSNTRQPGGGRILTDQGDRDPVTGQRYGNTITEPRKMSAATGRKTRKNKRY